MTFDPIRVTIDAGTPSHGGHERFRPYKWAGSPLLTEEQERVKDERRRDEYRRAQATRRERAAAAERDDT